MKAERQYWIETVGKTFLYYRVTARSKAEALRKFNSGQEDYVGCTDGSTQRIRAVLEQRPHTEWH